MEAAGAEDTRLPVPALHISSIMAGCRTRPPRGRGWHGIFPHQCDKEGPFCSARDERLIPNSLGILCPLNCAIIPPSSGIHSILSV